MLSSMVKEHQAKQATRKEQQGKDKLRILYGKLKSNWISEQKRKEAIDAANELTEALVDHLNVG